MLLEGKCAVITGGASGIGAGSARVFAREGARVAIFDRNIELAREVLGELEPVAGGEHLAVAVDVASPEAIDAAFAEVDSAFGRVDALANCAGITGAGSPLEVTLEEWQQIQDVNLTAPFYCAQHAARRMVAQGDGGTIVLISSTAGLLAINQRAAYCASKAGVLGLTRSLALDLGEHGIRVNAICPGFVRTGLTAPYLVDEEWTRETVATIPLPRVAEPAELADVVAFLSSDMSRYVSGVTLPVDAGMTATRPLGGSGTAFSVKRAPTGS